MNTPPIDSDGVFNCARRLGQHQEPQAVGFDVLLVDSVIGRRRAISRIIAETGGTARVVEISLLKRVGELPDSCRMALVALGNPIGPAAPVLELIASLRKAGCQAVAFEDGAHLWNVEAKCLPLRAGVSEVLDSLSVSFTAKLRHLLEQALQAQAGGRIADQAVQLAMGEHGMVGNSPAMLAVFRKAIHFSRLGSLPVLLSGETGTGKELLARAIHGLDPNRTQGPFVPVNCAAINPGLVESEVFGHRRGAFTGAERDRKGLIRTAEGGVMFLDEIGELDLGLQAKLLRVLQENKVLTVGAEQEVPVNVRFIAATNRDLERMVAERKFRLDLFHRLHVLLIRIAPLRERPSDIGSLIEHFVRKHQTLKAEPPRGVSTDFVEAFRKMDLPGNAREVENLVCEAFVNHQGDGELSLSDLPVEALRQLTEQAETTGALASDAETPGRLPHLTSEQVSELVRLMLDGAGWNLSRATNEWERQVFAAALHRARGNQCEIARLLGVTRRSVYKKLHKYHLSV